MHSLFRVTKENSLPPPHPPVQASSAPRPPYTITLVFSRSLPRVTSLPQACPTYAADPPLSQQDHLSTAYALPHGCPIPPLLPPQPPPLASTFSLSSSPPTTLSQELKQRGVR